MDLEEQVSDLETRLAAAELCVQSLTNDMDNTAKAHNIVAEWSKDSMQLLLDQIVVLQRKAGVTPLQGR